MGIVITVSAYINALNSEWQKLAGLERPVYGYNRPFGYKVNALVKFAVFWRQLEPIVIPLLASTLVNIAEYSEYLSS